MPAWWRSVAAGTLAGVRARRHRLGLLAPGSSVRASDAPAGGLASARRRRPVALPPAVERLRAARPGRPLLLHFFNPSCPCSRFNVDHVRALSSRFQADVTVVAVLAEGEPATMRAAYRALQLDVPHYVDADRRLADALGVYATPQAAILDGAGRLYFVGNYNRTRYCRDRDTEFARLALEAVVAGGATAGGVDGGRDRLRLSAAGPPGASVRGAGL